MAKVNEITEMKVNDLYAQGRLYIERGDMLRALSFFEEFYLKDSHDPTIMSYYGYLIFHQRGQKRKGISLCEQCPASSRVLFFFHHQKIVSLPKGLNTQLCQSKGNGQGMRYSKCC